MTRAIPIRAGFFHDPPSGAEPPYPIGSRCVDCARAFLPRRIRCPRCSGRALKEIALSSRGTLHTYTVIHQAHPGAPTTGMAQITEITWQLREQAGRRQVRGATAGLTHTLGGGGMACAVTVLTR